MTTNMLTKVNEYVVTFSGTNVPNVIIDKGKENFFQEFSKKKYKKTPKKNKFIYLYQGKENFFQEFSSSPKKLKISPNGFANFYEEFKHSVRQDNLKLSSKDILKLLTAVWNELPKNEKEIWTNEPIARMLEKYENFYHYITLVQTSCNNKLDNSLKQVKYIPLENKCLMISFSKAYLHKYGFYPENTPNLNSSVQKISRNLIHYIDNLVLKGSKLHILLANEKNNILNGEFLSFEIYFWITNYYHVNIIVVDNLYNGNIGDSIEKIYTIHGNEIHFVSEIYKTKDTLKINFISNHFYFEESKNYDKPSINIKPEKLKKYTVKQLQELCKKMKISKYSKKRKSELINLLCGY